MTERFEQLVWAELDEELSASDARELATLRAGALGSGGEAGAGGSKEAALEADIRLLAARLAEVEDVEAPTALKGLILEAVDQSASRPPKPGSDGVLGDTPGFGLSPTSVPPASRGRADRGAWLSWRFLAAAGLVIGAVVVYQVATSSNTTHREGALVGTIKPSPSVSTPKAAIPAEFPNFVELVGHGNRLTASVALEEGASTVVLAAPGLEVEGVEFQEGAVGSYESDVGRLTLHLSGPGRVEVMLLFAKPDQSFTLSTVGIGPEPFEGEFLLYQLSGS